MTRSSCCLLAFHSRELPAPFSTCPILSFYLILGDGTYGIVSRGLLNGVEVAVKVTPKADDADKMRQSARDEILVMRYEFVKSMVPFFV